MDESNIIYLERLGMIRSAKALEPLEEMLEAGVNEQETVQQQGIY